MGNYVSPLQKFKDQFEIPKAVNELWDFPRILFSFGNFQDIKKTVISPPTHQIE